MLLAFQYYYAQLKRVVSTVQKISFLLKNYDVNKITGFTQNICLASLRFLFSS